MSFIETSLQTSYPDEFHDTVAEMTASILQEQLAPIVETLREHARLLELHAALLNHSTAMNRYNVGKIDDIRDFQNNINFKLQFYIHPEDRWHPDYRTPSASTNTETLSNVESSLPVAANAHTQPNEPTEPATASSSSVEASSGLPDRPSTPAATEPADSRPTTPRQLELGDGFSVVPGPSRRLQRERPFSVAPDPMWNSSREIQPDQHLATHPPPPPYVLPPTYAEVGSPGQIEAVEQVVYPEPFPVEIIEIEPSALQSPTLDVRGASVLPSNIPPDPVIEEEAQNNPSHTIGPSSAHGNTSHSLDPSTFPETTISENETGDVGGSGGANSNVESQLSEKARGKKRMREEDYSSDEQDDSETLENLLDGGSCSGSGSGDRDGEPDRKRKKEGDTTINTDPLEVDSIFLTVARMGIVERLTDVEKWRQVKKLKEIEKLYRTDRLLA